MDETALRARSRLERKLRCLPSRLEDNKNERKETRSRDSSTRNSNGSRPGMLEEVKLQLSTRKYSTREVCSICLDEFKSQKAVINLPCSHRYHSDCLLPWLAVHSDCPYCRTAVPF
ncbi:hypothetical protein H6P81_004821 [Aristolochia fimbriata]|uniref:RING-type domain-containing protein n=1 Tax=Aristolochia fimbriata TaxID=158543 RepID=A0AAV7EWB6_ARIFI|nr:hypothetical protein H6P81_004821 [Aristolochia fimbriata]